MTTPLQQAAQAAAKDIGDLGSVLYAHSQTVNNAAAIILKHFAPLEAQLAQVEEQLLAIQSSSKCGTASATMIAVSNAESRVAAALQERDEARREVEMLKAELSEMKKLARQACDERYEIEQQATYERNQRKHTT